MKWTEEKTWKDNHHSRSSFIYPSLGFINNPIRGIKYIKNNIVPYLGGGEVNIGTEAIYQTHSFLDNLRDSSILIIGAGPTCNATHWSSDKYDYIFSCNHFFLNKKVKNCGLSGVFVGDEVDLHNQEFISFIEKQESIIFFENIGRDMIQLKKFKEKYKKRVVWAHTRYHSKLGVVPRMIAFFCLFGPKKIDIVGMDGFIRKSNKKLYLHSFENNKSNNCSIDNVLNENLVEEIYRQQYLEFWDYILHNIGKNIQFNNLGHGHPANMTTEVLTKKIGKNYQDYLLNTEFRI